MISLTLGKPLPLRLQIDDGSSDKFVKAYVFNGSNNLVNSIILSHLVNGLYVGYYTPNTADTYHASYVLYSDNTYTTNLGPYYQNSSDTFVIQSIADFGEAVWDTNILDNNIANSAAVYVKNINTVVESITPEELAAAVWNQTTTDFNLSNSFGLLLNVLKLTTLNMENELNSNTDGLQAIHDHITNQAQLIIGEVNQNEVKIDSIFPAISSNKSALSSEHGAITLLLQALATSTTQNKNDIITEVVTNRTKIDEVKSYVLSISNNTTVRFVVPEQIIKPAIGTSTYRFYLRLFDDTGHPEAPDSSPVIVVQDIVTNASSSGVMLQDGVKLGAYYFDYTIASGSPTNPLFIEATVIEGGVTRYIPATSQVTEFSTDLNAIQTQLNTVNIKVTDSQNRICSNIYGLQAIHEQLTSVDGDVLSVKSSVTAIKSITDALPTNIATATDIANIMASMAALPTLVQISNILTITKQAIIGTDGKTNSDIYSKIDFTGIMKTNDARLGFLDANISSRSTITANDIWNFATRTLTAITIPTVEARKIWEVLTTDVGVIGSFGALIKNMLDTQVSTRATQSQVTNALSGVAQQSSLANILSTVVGEVNQNEIKINTLLSLLNIIAPDVAVIKNTKSLETTVNSQSVAISSTLSSLNLLINAIKIQTDKIPLDPARESSVTLRPTNPLLANDSRVSNLDSKISTRSILKVDDLATLATHTNVVAETSTIISALGSVVSAIDNVLNNINPIPTNNEMDAKLGNLSTLNSLEQAKNEIISVMSHINGGSGGSGASAAEVWAYPNRNLTGPVDINPSQLSDIAKTSDTNNYDFHIHTAILNGYQTVFVSIANKGNILDIDGIIVTMKRADETTLWSTSSNTNSDKVHIVTSPVTLTVNTLYYIQVTANINNVPVISTLPFTTVC